MEVNKYGSSKRLNFVQFWPWSFLFTLKFMQSFAQMKKKSAQHPTSILWFHLSPCQFALVTLTSERKVNPVSVQRLGLFFLARFFVLSERPICFNSLCSHSALERFSWSILDLTGFFNASLHLCASDCTSRGLGVCLATHVCVPPIIVKANEEMISLVEPDGRLKDDCIDNTEMVQYRLPLLLQRHINTEREIH